MIIVLYDEPCAVYKEQLRSVTAGLSSFYIWK